MPQTPATHSSDTNTLYISLETFLSNLEDTNVTTLRSAFPLDINNTTTSYINNTIALSSVLSSLNTTATPCNGTSISPIPNLHDIPPESNTCNNTPSQLILKNTTPFPSMLCTNARPQHTQEAVRMARAMIRGCNNNSANTIAATLEKEAWAEIPPQICPALMRSIASKRDNLPYLMTHEQKQRPGGTGIRSEIVGEVVHLDIQIKSQKDKATGTFFALVCTDEATLWTRVYGLKTKADSVHGLTLYVTEMSSFGHQVTSARSDAASEVTSAYLDKLNKKLPEEYSPLPEWETVKRVYPLIRQHQSTMLFCLRDTGKPYSAIQPTPYSIKDH